MKSRNTGTPQDCAHHAAQILEPPRLFRVSAASTRPAEGDGEASFTYRCKMSQ